MIGSMTLGGRFARPLMVALVGVVMGTALVGVLGSVLGVAGGTTSRSMSDLIAVSRAVATPVFLAAGVLRLSRWHITGDPCCGLRGVALLVMGGVSLPSLTVARSLSAAGDGVTVVACVRALSVGAVLYVLAVALSDDVSRRADFRRSAGLATAAAAALTLPVLLLERDRLPSADSLQGMVVPSLEVVLAVAWLALAVRSLMRGRHARWARRTAPLLAAMGLAEACRLPDRPSTTLVAASLTAGVAFVVAGSALVDLVRAAQAEHATSKELTRELTDARTEISGRDAWRADLAHDARGTLAGIRAAISTLDRHGDDLDEDTATRLRHATLAELAHLEQMLEPRAVDDDVFDVADVVRSVTEVRRAAGLSVEVTPRSARVRGVPGDLATALQNLLVNAHQHAPGATVWVEVQLDPRHARIVVEDDGPGIPSAAAATAFARGGRGPHSQGSGLGLSIARTLTRRHGGDLHLSPSGRGTTFVISWPLAEHDGVTPLPWEVAAS
jgi:signal transduction histidine kinase